MTPKRPIELIRSSIALSEAWTKLDELNEAGDKIGASAMANAIVILQERYNSLYQQWQILGGTSDITSIALPLSAEHYEKNFTDSSDERLNERAVRIHKEAEATLKNADGSWKPFKSWASYPRQYSEPLSAEDVDGTLILGE